MKFEHIQQFFFFGLLAGVTILFLWTIGTYLLPVFWAAVIATIFYPWHKKIEKIVKGRSTIASLLSVFSVIIIVLIPVVVIGGLVVQESVRLYQDMSQDSYQSVENGVLHGVGKIVARLEPLAISEEVVTERLRGWTANIAEKVAGSFVAFTQITFSFFIYTLITLYLLFFFFRDGKKIHDLCMYYLPLRDKDENRLLTRFVETTRAVMKGSLFIGILQGIAGGLTFLVVGLPNPILWGVAMGAFSLVPAVGTMIVWLPAGIILLVTGSVWQGITVLVSGVLLVSSIDEFLRPTLIGRGASMPESIMLLATIGGLATFGISGLVIGPIIAAFFLSVWGMFGERYHTELSNN